VRAGFAVATTATLIAVAGCGGRSEGEIFREDSLAPAEERVERARAEVAATLRVVRPGRRRDARALDDDVDALAASVRRLDGLLPPTFARARFDDYAGALRELVVESRRFADAIGRGESAALPALAQALRDRAGRVQRGHDALEQTLLEEE
jgi:hypothetical protein